MKNRFWALIVSMVIFIGAIPGLPVFAVNYNVTLNVGFGGLVNSSLKSDEEGEFYTDKSYVEPGETVTWTVETFDDYYFIGWSTSPSAEDVFSQEHSYEFTPADGETYDIYALFEEYITVTFHFGTIEDPDVIEPVQIKGTVGTHHGEFRASDEYQAAESKLMAEFGFETAYFETPRTKSLKEIVEEEAYDSYFLDVDDRIYITSDVYETMMLPITSVNVTLDPPVAGKTNETLPVITVPDGFHYSFPTETEEVSSAYWFDPNNTEETYDVTFECDNTYYARFCLRADTGYYFDLTTENVTVNNDKPYQIDEDGLGEQWMAASVTLEHNWSDWEPTKQATATEPGVLTRTCSVCGATEEKEYTLETTATDNKTAEVETTSEAQPGTIKPADSISDHIENYYVDDVGIQWRYYTLNGNGFWEFYNTTTKTWHPGTYPFHIFSHTTDADLISKLASVTITNSATGVVDTLTKSADNTLVSAFTGEGAARLEAGSVIINVYPSYLDTLKAGDYTLTAYFDDGSISINFKVEDKAATSVPATGEAVSSTMIWGAVLVSIAVISAGVVLNKKRLSKKDLK